VTGQEGSEEEKMCSSTLSLTSTLEGSGCLTFRHRASCILGHVFLYSPENAFYIFNQQIYFII